MLNKIIQFSLQNRWVVLLSALLLTIWGTYTASTMEIDVFPDLNAPTVVVMTEAQGMAPEEVERLVTFPIETAVNGATDIRRVRSSSTTGFSIVWVEFEWGTDLFHARQIVSEKLALIKDELPQQVGTPTLGPPTSILGELMVVHVTADTTSLQDLRTLADWQIRPRLLATGGVAQVSVLGGDIKEYQILLHPDQMKQLGIGLNEVYAAVRQMNQNTTGGMLYEYGNAYLIRCLLSTHQLSELAQAVVCQRNGSPVRLQDIATVKIGNKSPQTGLASYNEQAAVALTITKQPNTNTIDLTQQIDRTLATLQAQLPPDVKIHSDVYRQARFIENAVHNVRTSLYEGGIFVIIVLFLFLMNTRTTLISLLTIPLSLLTSIIVLHLMGETINTMSLGGMCIAIGSLVDDAIVDVENVFKRLRENQQQDLSARKSVLQVVFHASKEVRLPILNSTLIIIASFVPLFFLTGMEGRLLFPLGVAFIVSLCSSTLVALTLTPVLCSLLLGGTKGKWQQKLREPLWVNGLKRHYATLLNWSLTHSQWVLTLTGVACVAAVVLFFSLGKRFLPAFNEGSFTINLTTLPGVSLDTSDAIGRAAEKALLSIPEIQCVGRKTGRAELDEHVLGVNSSEIEAPFELQQRSKAAVIADIREKLSQIPGVRVEVGAPISHRIDAMLSGTRASIAIKIFGTQLSTMYQMAQQIESVIADTKGLTDLNVEQQVERPQLQIRPKRTLLAEYGISLPEFAEQVQTLLSGSLVSQVYEGNKAFDLTLKATESDRQTVEAIRNLTFNANGKSIPLYEIADITYGNGPHTIQRENVARKLVISANISGNDLSGTVQALQQRIAEQIQLPEGYHIEFGGQFENEKKASQRLFITSWGALLVIFMLLVHQFKSWRQATLILLNLPLALIGGVMALALTQGAISIPAIIGFISLFGIATRNGMLLIAHYNDLELQGMSPKARVLKGSIDRLNPILMTALTSAFALIPLALNGDMPGNEIQSPMAQVILGGLISSTLLNAVIIPILYLRTLPHHPSNLASSYDK